MTWRWYWVDLLLVVLLVFVAPSCYLLSAWTPRDDDERHCLWWAGVFTVAVWRWLWPGLVPRARALEASILSCAVTSVARGGISPGTVAVTTGDQDMTGLPGAGKNFNFVHSSFLYIVDFQGYNVIDVDNKIMKMMWCLTLNLPLFFSDFFEEAHMKF